MGVVRGDGSGLDGDLKQEEEKHDNHREKSKQYTRCGQCSNNTLFFVHWPPVRGLCFPSHGPIFPILALGAGGHGLEQIGSLETALEDLTCTASSCSPIHIRSTSEVDWPD